MPLVPSVNVVAVYELNLRFASEAKSESIGLARLEAAITLCYRGEWRRDKDLRRAANSIERDKYFVFHFCYLTEQ